MIRRWYHVTRDWTAPQITVSPRPVRADIDCDDDTEPCICACPTVAQCIVGIDDWHAMPDSVAVYVCEASYAVPAPFVFEAVITDEHRLYEPTRFVRVGSIDMAALRRAVPAMPAICDAYGIAKHLADIQTAIKSCAVTNW